LRRGWVVDASVVAKLFLLEDLSDKARELFRLAHIEKGRRLAAPDFVFGSTFAVSVFLSTRPRKA
jgi:predicted nucleic acid-binding protein